MKKFFLIPLMTLCTCVMAWGGVAHVSNITDLKAAVANASVETIYLDADINYTGTTDASCINILRSVTIDGQGHTLSGYGKRGTTSNYPTIAINQGGSSMVDVVIKNMTINNTKSSGRPVETRGKINSITLDNVKILATGGGNPQGLTIGGNQASKANISIIDSEITIQERGGYPVISFNPYILTARNSKFTGFCALYFKGIDGSAGSAGTVVNADNCDFNAPNSFTTPTNSFGVFVMEDHNITLNLHNCGVDATQTGTQLQSMLLLSSWGDRSHRSQDINLNISGDNSHINGRWVTNAWIQDYTDANGNTVTNYQYAKRIYYEDGSYFKYATLPTYLGKDESKAFAYTAGINVTITGGTFSIDPSTYQFIDHITSTSYDEEEGFDYEVSGRGLTIPSTHEVQEIKQGDVTLYRVVKKAEEKEPGVLYDLNDAVETAAEGENPVTSFNLSTGGTMELDEEREVTTAGYVQIKDNEDSGTATVVKVGTTADADPTQKVDQTLVINNGLDVQGESQVIVEAGSTLIVGEGGINTEDPENIVLNVTEDEGASLLLDPTITINKNPNLTVKLTTNSKQLTASPWTYVYQRFAIPVQVGIVPTNDFDGELFPGNTSFKNYVFEWNGYDWVTCSSWGALKPFKGYQLANNSKEGGVTYTFTGQLVGNDNSVYNFPTGGFDFFGNSHLAPIYIDSLLKPYEDQAVEASVWLYNYESKNFEAITSEDIADGWAFATEIKPMEGFILNYHGASGSAGMNYASAIWGNPKFDAAIGRPSQSNPAPARNRVSETSNRAIINVVAENGQGDNVKLVEKEKYSAEFENGADASKFVYDNAVSIYASTENGELSRVATNDLTGTLLSFNSNDATNYTITLSNVLGEDYALRDNVTGQTIAFAEGATYTFTQAANTTVPARFEVVSAAKLPTAIDNVEEAAKVSGIYTITGQYLGHDFTNLPAGVYIVNGVKIVK